MSGPPPIPPRQSGVAPCHPATNHTSQAAGRSNQSQNTRGEDWQLTDDEAVAKALQDEYDREHSDLRQQVYRGRSAQQASPDYRRAGYSQPDSSSMPSVVPASCTMCQGVTPVPYAPGRLQFRCDRCGFLNTCTIPRGRPAFGSNGYYDEGYPMPLICCIS